MNTAQIISAVKQERDRLNKVIALLEPQTSEPTPVTTKAEKREHRWSAKQRAEMSAKLRASWAARKSGKKSKM